MIISAMYWRVAASGKVSSRIRRVIKSPPGRNSITMWSICERKGKKAVTPRHSQRNPKYDSRLPTRFEKDSIALPPLRYQPPFFSSLPAHVVILEGIMQGDNPWIVRHRQHVALGPDVAHLVFPDHGLLDHGFHCVDFSVRPFSDKTDLPERVPGNAGEVRVDGKVFHTFTTKNDPEKTGNFQLFSLDSPLPPKHYSHCFFSIPPLRFLFPLLGLSLVPQGTYFSKGSASDDDQ